jgi:hypothetical protein
MKFPHYKDKLLNAVQVNIFFLYIENYVKHLNKKSKVVRVIHVDGVRMRLRTATTNWHIVHPLYQGWANYGPLRDSMRPAEGLENAKKNEVSKTICAQRQQFLNTSKLEFYKT